MAVAEQDFNKTFSDWQNRNPINKQASELYTRGFETKYDNNCKEIYDIVLNWNKLYSGVKTRLMFTSELIGIIYPTTYCYVKFRGE